MIQVITPTQQKRNLSGELGSALGAGLSQGYSQEVERQRQAKELAGENESIKNNFGIDLTGTHTPEIRKQLVAESLKGNNQKQKMDLSEDKDAKNYDFIKQYAGQNAANLYKSAPPGGKTKIIQRIVDATERGENLEELFDPQNIGMSENYLDEPEINPESNPEKIKKTPILDYDKGKTPSERNRSQEKRYTTNLPLYQESLDKSRSLDSEFDKLAILEELSPQIGTFERLNIDPRTGDLIIPALASPEAQRYVKTINDFTVNAKDSYGARVTNFDLQQFMRRLPNLGNSEEARSQIIEQMKIINEINKAHQDSLKEVIEDHGGVRYIDWDKAQSLADKKAKPKVNEAKKKFSQINNYLEKAYRKDIEDFKKTVPLDHVAVEGADGSQGYIPKNMVKDFLSVQGNRVL